MLGLAPRRGKMTCSWDQSAMMKAANMKHMMRDLCRMRPITLYSSAP